MYFYCICGKEGDLCVLIFRHLLSGFSGFVLLFIFQGFSYALSIESSSSALSFFLIFSVSMNLGKTVTYFGLEAMFLGGSTPI